MTLTPDAKVCLVETGYDPRLGARPMRRVVQRSVENLVAKQLLSSGGMPGATIELTKEQLESVLGTKQAADKIASSCQTPLS